MKCARGGQAGGLPSSAWAICTVHVCTINSHGKKPEDPAWTKRYFRIRGELTDKESTIVLDDL